MKRLSALLICFIMIASLFSCNFNFSFGNEDDTQNGGDATDLVESNKQETDGDKLEGREFFKIEELELTKVRYYIYDLNGNQVLCKETDRPLTISMLTTSVVQIRISMGTAITQTQYYDVLSNRFSETFDDVVAASGNLVAYLGSKSEVTSIADRKLIVQDIFDETVFCKAFGLDFSPAMLFPIESAEFTENENELELVYYSERPATPFSITLPIRYNFDDYESIIRVYRYIAEEINLSPYYENLDIAIHLGLTDEREIELCEKLYTSALSQPKPKFNSGYAIKDLNGDGEDELVLFPDGYIITHVFSLCEGRPVLLDNYWSRKSCWIDGEGLLHVDGSGGAGCNDTSIYKIAEGGKEFQLVIGYGMCDHNANDENGIPIPEYYVNEGGEKKVITKAEFDRIYDQYEKYLGIYAGAEATEKLSGLVREPLFNKNEFITKILEAVKNGKIELYDTSTKTTSYIKNVKAPYSGMPLSALEKLGYAYADLDGDGVDEMVIDCGDTVILRYYEEKVYAYAFTFKNMYDLKSDGRHSFQHNGEDFVYGESQIFFEGEKLATKRLWHIVNDGDNAEYYIGEQRVSKEALDDYYERLNQEPSDKIEFSPLVAPWCITVSESEAKEIAEKYWKIKDGTVTYATGDRIIERIKVIDGTADNYYPGYYYVCWEQHYYSADIFDAEGFDSDITEAGSVTVYKKILIDRFTGEIMEMSDYFGGK